MSKAVIIERFRKEIWWTLRQCMDDKPDELSENEVLLLMHAGLLDFVQSQTLESIKKGT